MSHLLCSQDTRTHVVGELYDTERSYVESLQILVEKYMKPMKSLESNRALIDSVLVDEIFYSIPEILQHHENFLGALQDRLSSDWDSSQVIGNVFIEAIIDDYTAFINNWKNARQAIKMASQARPAFERFLEARSREHRNKLTLDALLIMPVQRIPRYELLIKELIKHTPENHPDHEPLMEAQKKIHELALKIDRAEKEMIHQEQLRDLEALIEGHVELQHHQRDFIRYDLVTIVSASALTATKKERVLFLFCDLLIMTSIKKKASRRSDLQNAFANSTNDLSLLEGNKFKLLLRVPIDQIEIRLDYDQMQLQQQHQEEQHQFHLERQNKLIQERRHQIEADLQTLNQIESLAANLSHVNRAKLDDVITETLTDLRQILANIEHNDMQMLNDEQHSLLSRNSAQDLYLTPSPASISSASASAQQQLPAGSQSNHLQVCPSNQQLQGQSASPVPQSHHHHSHESNTTLEFLINNNNIGSANSINNNGASSKESNESHTIDHQGYTLGASIGHTLSTVADNTQLLSSQSSTSDSLVVTFSSIERRQAFIRAFIEAKQQRYQQRQQHQGKIFSSSVTLKLVQPGSMPATGVHEKRSPAPPDPKAHHQESDDSYLAGLLAQRPSSLSSSTTSRISSSAPLQNQTCGAAIVHQMSAPQSLALAVTPPESRCTDEWLRSSQCTSCSYNLVAEAEQAQLRHNNNNNNNHHHHQLMHQPASHPASLNTICCHDSHNNWDEEDRKQLGICDDIVYEERQQQGFQCRDYNQHMNCQIGLNSVVNLNSASDTANKSTIANTGPGNGCIEDQQKTSQQLIDQMNFNLLLAKCAPKFLVTLPVDFLSTQQPALQFTCSALGKYHSTSSDPELVELKDVSSGSVNRECLKSATTLETLPTVSQTIEDNLGQLWLCMSNGYVSHVALVTIKKRELRRLGSDGQPEPMCGHGSSSKNCYSIMPVVISSGDICKSHINCAAQVKWSKSPLYDDQTAIRQTVGSAGIHNDEALASFSDNPKDETRPTEIEANNEVLKAARNLGEVDQDSQSPSIDIKCQDQARTLIQGSVEYPSKIPESAASSGSVVSSQKISSNFRRTSLSASATKLELPSSGTKNWSGMQSKGTHQHNRSFNMQNRPGSERKRSIHDEICHRQNHHSSSTKQLNDRTAASSSVQQIPRASRHHHHYLHNHHQHHHHHHTQPHHNLFKCHSNLHSYNYAPQNSKTRAIHQHIHLPNQHLTSSHRHRIAYNHRTHSHTHSHQHHHQHHQQQHQLLHSNNQIHHVYGARHNTVPITDLRRSLDRQDTIESLTRPDVGSFPAQQATVSDATSSSSPSKRCEKVNSLDQDDQRQSSVSPKMVRSTTPNSLATASMKGFRSARLMRHQASLKTSSILAKLVGSTTRRSGGTRRTDPARDKSSDLDDNDNDTDTDTAPQQPQNNSSNKNRRGKLEKNKSSATDKSGFSRASSQQLDPAMMATPIGNSAVISPLSSVSSLNSTTSSFTVNSVCASSPNASSCELLTHSYSTTCCVSGGGLSSSTQPPTDQNGNYTPAATRRSELCGHRGRAATAPSRALCGKMFAHNVSDQAECALTHHRSFAIIDPTFVDSATSNSPMPKRAYKVSEIINDANQVLNDDQERQDRGETKRSSGSASRTASPNRKMNSSLWLGCDDGSLIIIDCLIADVDSQSACPDSNDANGSSRDEQKTFTCGNVHSEIKLSSPICDISTYKDEKVFVALTNGQLAVFSRSSGACGDTDKDSDVWSLTNPEMITVTENELNSTARLCQIDDKFLWYSYGRNIFVLDIATLKLETTIKAPTNDLSLRLTVQAITIDSMELVQNLSGVWVSFRNSHLIQFYDTESYKLLIEINLFDPINKLLSYGNEIIRQHKTACLKATSILNYYNKKEQCNTLFVGTSAGIILYLTITAGQLISKESAAPDWEPQIVSLRHGHSGHVKLLRLIRMDGEQQAELAKTEQRKLEDENNKDTDNESQDVEKALYLISGGSGLDIYGPSGEQQNFISQLNRDEDNVNHLMIWQL